MAAPEKVTRIQWIGALLICAGSAILFTLQYRGFPTATISDWRKWIGLALFVAGVVLLNPWGFHQYTKFQRWQPGDNADPKDD